MKILSICIMLLCLTNNLIANDYYEETNYILRNKVKIKRIDKYLFSNKYPLEQKKLVAGILVRYKNDEAVILMNKLLNDTSILHQSMAIIPLINAGYFELGFNKFQRLVKANSNEVIINFYTQGSCGEYSGRKIYLYRKYKNQFLPFLKETCQNKNINYQIKYWAAETLFFLEEKNISKKTFIEILENVPNPAKPDKYLEYSKYSDDKKANWHLRNRAKQMLEMKYSDLIGRLNSEMIFWICKKNSVSNGRGFFKNGDYFSRRIYPNCKITDNIYCDGKTGTVYEDMDVICSVNSKGVFIDRNGTVFGNIDDNGIIWLGKDYVNIFPNEHFPVWKTASIAYHVYEEFYEKKE